MVELGKYYTQEKLAVWEAKYNFTSLRKYNSSNPANQILTDMDVPMKFTAILNDKGEYAVGNVIVWFNKGYTYMIPKMDESLLQEIKKTPSNIKTKYKLESSVVKGKGGEVQTNGSIGLNSLDARYQHIWAPNSRPGGEHWRKTVYEIVASSVPTGEGPSGETFYDYSFVARVKLEYYDSNGNLHSNAGETRVIDKLSLSGNVRGNCGGATPTPFNVNIAPTTTTSDVVIELVRSSGISGNSCLEQLDYYIYGQISTHSTWTNNVSQYDSYYSVPSGQPDQLWQ